MQESVDIAAERICEVLLTNDMERVLPLSFASIPLVMLPTPFTATHKSSRKAGHTLNDLVSSFKTLFT